MSMGIYGNAAELRKAADDLDAINEAGMAAYLQKAGEKLDAGKLKEMYDAETWLTAAQCIELGIADISIHAPLAGRDYSSAVSCFRSGR